MFYTLNPEQGLLNKEESKHCVRVLRHAVGDTITLFNGKGEVYEAILKKLGNNCEFEIKGRAYFEAPEKPIQIAVAPPKKSGRFDFMIEKMVELGVSRIYLLTTQHSERQRINEERLNKQIITACKQSRQYHLPDVIVNSKLDDLMKTHYKLVVCHCNENYHRKHLNELDLDLDNQIWCIGPEGDFSTAELEQMAAHHAGFVNLGEMRLRTETAAIYISSLLKSARV